MTGQDLISNLKILILKRTKKYRVTDNIKMDQKLIDLWIEFLSTKDPYTSALFLNIMHLTGDLYPELTDVANSPECSRACDMVHNHRNNPVMKQLIED